MAVEVEVTGGGRYAGAKSAIGTYSVSEESTPIVASDSSGGVGQITFSAVDDPSRLGSVLLLDSELTLSDGERGTTVGTITGVTGNDGLLNVRATSRLGQLVADKTVPGVNDDFDTVARYYLEQVGIDGDIVIDDSLMGIPVIAPGWTGDMWTKFKELLVTIGAEVSLVQDKVVIRPIRQRDAWEANNINVSWNMEQIDLAKEVEIFYYNSQEVIDGLVYPYGGWNEDVSIFSVDTGQVETVNIPVNVSLTSLQQPVVQDYVSKAYGASSVYAVVGNDNKPITAAQWTASNGKLTVAIGEDGQSIDVTMVGGVGAVSEYAPFRIAVSAGSGDHYSSLRLIGSGIGFDKQSIILPTGVDPDTIPRDVGVTVDNVFIRTKAQAYDIGTAVAGKWASPTRTISITKAEITKSGETDTNLNYKTFADFDEYAVAESLTTFGDFDAEWAGQTFGDFDNYWYELVKEDLSLQVFGNVNGSRLQWRRAKYRIRTAEITESGVSFSAEADTTFGDFDESAAGMTFADFDALYDGLTFADFDAIPLPIVEDHYDQE